MKIIGQVKGMELAGYKAGQRVASGGTGKLLSAT